MKAIRTSFCAAGVCTLLAAALSPAAFAGSNAWTGAGPEGGDIRRVEYEPDNGNVVLATTPAGLYRSTNGGAAWTLHNADLVSLPFAFDPTDANIIYFADFVHDQILRSDDGGTTTTVLASWPASAVTAIDVGVNGIVYAGSDEQGVFRSTDGGTTWDDVGSGLVDVGGGLIAAVDGVFADPVDPNIVYVSLASFALGLYRCDAGIVDPNPKCAPRNMGLPSLTISDLAIAPGNNLQLYAATDVGVFYSTDRAAHWQTPTAQIPSAQAVAVDPADPSIAYSGSFGGDFFKSIDAGVTWNTANVGFSTSAVRDVAVSPSSGLDLIAATTGGLSRSTNGAGSWISANSGIVASNIMALAADPVTTNNLYASANGVFKTTRGGASWTNLTDVGASALIIDPANTAILYAATAGGIQKSIDSGVSYNTVLAGEQNLLAYSAADGAIYAFDSKAKGLYRTQDGGQNWTTVGTGVLPSSPDSFIVDSTNASTLYEGTDDSGAFKSTNGGVSWSVQAGVLSKHVPALIQDPTDPAIVYAGTDDGVFRTDDGGATWALTGNAAATKSLALAPGAPEIVYAGTSTGVLRSLDSGASWAAIPATDAPVWTANQLAVDAIVRYRVYAGTATRGMQAIDLAHDLQLAITGPNGNVALDADFDYTVTITNAGPGDAPRVTLTQTLPTNKSTYAAATPAQGSCTPPPDNMLTCDLGVLPAGAQTSVVVTLTSNATGAISSSATVNDFDAETLPNDNTATAAGAQVTQLYDLVATMTAPGTAHVGDHVTYTATVTNDGPNTAAGVSIVTSIPGNATFFNAVPGSGARCTRDVGTLTCTVGTLDMGESSSVDVTYNADSAGALTATMSVSANGGAEADTSNDSASVTTQASSSGGGGGGGTPDALSLLALALAIANRRTRRRRTT